MKNPKISVIVPVYNAEKYLKRCIESILSQTFIDFELLLIDDGSTDSSGEICNEYAQADDRIRVFHKTNEGVSSARQFGCDVAIGEYSIHVDSDDYIEPSTLGDMITEAKRRNTDVVVCDFYINYSHGKIKYKKQLVSDKSKELLIDILTSRTFGALWNKLIRHSLYRIYGVQFVKGINYCEDVLVLCQLLKHNLSVGYLPKGGYHYCFENSDSITRNYTLETFKARIEFAMHLGNVLPEPEYVKAIEIAALYVKLEAHFRGYLPLSQFNSILHTSIPAVWRTKRKPLSKLKYTLVLLFNDLTTVGFPSLHHRFFS